MNERDNLVSILVPVDRVLEVYAFLSRKEEASKDEEGSRPVKEISGDRPAGSDDWPQELIQRAYEESPQSMRKILDYFSERPDTVVRAEELIAVLEGVHMKPSKSSQLAGTLGAFGNRVGGRYERNDWPFFSWWVPEEKQVHYRMGNRTAEILSAIRRKEA